MKTFKLLLKIILYLVITVIVWFAVIGILGGGFKLNNNVSGGVAYLSVLYFWGIYFSRKEKFIKIFGIILYTLGVLINLVLVASPYDNKAEYASTRIFTLPALAAGIYLICRHEAAAKVFGILLVIFTILSFGFGFFFMVGNTTEFN